MPARVDPVAVQHEARRSGPRVLELGQARHHRAEDAVLRHQVARLVGIDEARRDVADSAESYDRALGLDQRKRTSRAAGRAQYAMNGFEALARRAPCGLAKLAYRTHRRFVRGLSMSEAVADEHRETPVPATARPSIAADGLALHRHHEAADLEGRARARDLEDPGPPGRSGRMPQLRDDDGAVLGRVEAGARKPPHRAEPDAGRASRRVAVLETTLDVHAGAAIDRGDEHDARVAFRPARHGDG